MLVLSYYVILFFSRMKSERFTKFCWMMIKILLDLTPGKLRVRVRVRVARAKLK